MSPQIGKPPDHASTHEDGGADEINLTSLSGTPAELATHAADPNAHHPEEIPEGRGRYNTTTLLSIPGTDSLSATTLEYVKDRIYYMPILVRTPITIDQFTIEVTTAAAAGEKCRIAIYAADTDWQPGARQVASAEIAIDANAVVDAAITETTLQEGRYLIAITLQGTATLRTMRYINLPFGFMPTFGGTPNPIQIYVAAPYAELPVSGTAWDTVVTSNININHPVLLRVKTP